MLTLPPEAPKPPRAPAPDAPEPPPEPPGPTLLPCGSSPELQAENAVSANTNPEVSKHRRSRIREVVSRRRAPAFKPVRGRQKFTAALQRGLSLHRVSK